MGTPKEAALGITQYSGGPGFDTWSFRVKVYMNSAGVLRTLTEDVPATEAAGKAKFEEDDRRAQCIIVGFLADEILEVVRDKNTAKEMWSSLNEVYAQTAMVNQTLLRKQLARLRMKEGASMRSHLQAFDDIVRQLKTAGEKMEEKSLVSQLFLSLPDSYDPLVTALENIKESELKLDMVKQRLLAEEQKRADRMDDAVDDKAAAFSGQQQNREQNKRGGKFKGKCHNCGKPGHMKKDCRGPKKEVHAAVSFMVNRCGSTKSDGRIINFKLDSGSSEHLVNVKTFFNSTERLSTPVVINVAKDGEDIVARDAGVINGYSNHGVLLNVKNVLYVPDLRENLLSVKRLAVAGVEVLFLQDKAVLKKDDVIIATAPRKGNLYELNINVSAPVANVCQVDRNELWHRRLGHLGQGGMAKIVQKDMAIGVDFKPGQLRFCDACAQGKQCRDPFDGTRERAKRPLERVHSDVCGPIDPPAWDGSRYFVSFIDDKTHFAMIYLMKRKSEVFEKFQEYEALVTAQFGTRISKLTVDRGREYFSTVQKKFYKTKGIQVEATVAYTPQQNGVAERFNRTLVEKVRTMLIDSSMPKSMWNEAAQTAVYLINRSPSAAVAEGATPAEWWTGSKPDLSKLRVFGCKAYAWIPGQLRKKLDAKSQEVIMIGYAPNGYRLWNKNGRKVVIARDVRFDESCFPYSTEPKKEEKPLIVLPSYEQEGERDPPTEAEPDGEDERVDGDPDNSQEDFQDPEDVELPEDVDPPEDVEPAEPATNALPSQTERRGAHGEASRHSERERRFPGKLLDYITGYGATSAAFSSTLDVPQTYQDVLNREDRDAWLAAIQDELKSMETNQVWKLVPCPANVKPLKTKWVFRVKEDEQGRAVRHKARLVAKGFLQKPGLDYEETYAPVAKLSTIRIILAVGVHEGFFFHQMDVKTAFLHGELKETIFISVPDGVTAAPGTACLLQKSLYGLKQSPRCWNQKFTSEIEKMGFVRSKRDYCLFVRYRDGDELYIVLYVDDLLIAGRNLDSIVKLKKKLCSVFAMTDCGELRHFLGMRIDYNRSGGTLRLSQETSITKVLNRFGMGECNPTKTPMEKGLQLSRGGPSAEEPYRELLGSLMYIMLCVRPDVCYPVGYLGRFQQDSSTVHWNALKRVVRYLSGTRNLSLKYQRDTESAALIGYADADWATDLQDRKSVSGFIFKVYGCTVSWSSKKQATVSLSSSEAEYVALSAAAAEAVWISGILNDLQVTANPVTIFEDNRGCVGMAKNLESKRTKHIDVKHHFIRDLVERGMLHVEPIGNRDQLADLFTKPLEATRFQQLVNNLGMSD